MEIPIEGIMKNINKTLSCVSTCACLFLGVATSVAQTPTPKRINGAIELLQAGQPIYYAGQHTGTTGTFEQGKLDAQTWADYLSYDMEVAPYDIAGLNAYMHGLVAGGPTRTGHRTPTVIVYVAVRGTDEATVRAANEWMFEQVLATGVHGILLVSCDHGRRGTSLCRGGTLSPPRTRGGPARSQGWPPGRTRRGNRVNDMGDFGPGIPAKGGRVATQS